MDDQTALILALQLIALCCIAAALLLYLLCRIRNRCDRDDADVALNLGLGRAVLLTSCDTAFGLQCALHLSKLGFRVFAGLREDDESGSLAAKILRAKLKEREMLASEEGASAATGPLITLPLDVTREDMLHEAVVQIRRHLPAGEDGLWAVINTAGICCKGRLENQENAHWDVMLKYNVVGSLRTARAFFSLLRNKKGRLINIGANDIQNSGLVAYTASRYAVEGASLALRNELTQYGIHVITLQPNGSAADKVFAHPKIGAQNNDKTDVHTVLEIQHSPNKYLDYNPTVLPLSAMRVLEEALLTKSPKEGYKLLPERKFWSVRRNVTAVQNKIVVTQRKNSQSAKT